MANPSLGLAGITTHPATPTERYNQLLATLGPAGMLEQVERWMDTADLQDLILAVEDTLAENE
jgi:hypothetical protein